MLSAAIIMGESSKSKKILNFGNSNLVCLQSVSNFKFKWSFAQDELKINQRSY